MSDKKNEPEPEPDHGTAPDHGRPTVEVLSATPDPDRLVCLGARNDYYEGYVGDDAFNTVMDGLMPSDDDREWAADYLAAKGADYEMNIDPVAKQRRLIGKLMDHGHWGPFEHPSITFGVKGLSRSCMAQLTRHRHASFDVQSMRYVAFDDKDPKKSVVHVPELYDPGMVGRNAELADEHAELEDHELVTYRNRAFWRSIRRSFLEYQQLLELGFAPENARMVLPIGTQVNLVVSVSLRSLLHIADMRAAGDAQFEIREMTEQLLDEAEAWAPISLGYFNDELKGRKNRLAP